MIGEFLLQLGKRDAIRQKLAELEERLGPDTVSTLLEQLEALVGRLGQVDDAPPTSPDVSRPVEVAEKVQPEPNQAPVPPPPRKDPFEDLLSSIDLKGVEMPEPDLQGSGLSVELPPVEYRVPGPKIEFRPPIPPPGVKAAPANPKIPDRPAVTPAPPVSPPPKAPPPPPPPPKPAAVRTPVSLDEEDIIYFHGVAQIPLNEKPAPEPFIMEEKGVDTKELVFALDRGGLRFYLSRITRRSTNVSKTGMLLLSKQESLHFRGTHFMVLNDLRLHGLLLPFEFGTVALGLEDLYAKIEEHMFELRDAAEELLSSKWWTVTVRALDHSMAKLVAPDNGPVITGRERDRRGAAERAGLAGQRIDIKTLERVLNKQKGIAEEIHQKLQGMAQRADVEMMVSLNSGSSEDWKSILRASYEISPVEMENFVHTIADLQYHHLKYQLMFVLTGDREDYSFQGR